MSAPSDNKGVGKRRPQPLDLPEEPELEGQSEDQLGSEFDPATATSQTIFGSSTPQSARTLRVDTNTEARALKLKPSANTINTDAPSATSSISPVHDHGSSPQSTSLNKLHPGKRSTASSVILVLTCTAAMILNISSATAIAITIPSIDRDLGIQEDQAQWLVSAFSLVNGCLLIFFGRLADLHGRKKAFILGVAWLGLFSLGCGFVQSAIALDVLRGLQGMGPAAIVPASLGILAHAFPPGRTRAAAFASFSAGAPLGGAIGNQIGGILTTWAKDTWRAPFFLTTGLSVLVIIGGCLSIDADEPSTEEDRRVDWLGAFLVTVGLVLILFVLGQGELAPQKWQTPYIIALLIVGVVFIILFIFWQYYLERSAGRTRPPLMKLSLWTRGNGRFAVVQVLAMLEWAAFQSFTFWMLLYYQDYDKLSPILAAIRTLPMLISGLLCNFVIALIIGHVDFQILMVFGTALTGVACLLFALINPNAVYWAFGLPAAICSVVGADFAFSAGTIFVARVALPHEQSLAGGLFQTLTQIGTSFGLAISTIVYNRVIVNDAQQAGITGTQNTIDQTAPPSAQLHAFQAAQWAGFAFAMFASLLCIMFLRGVGVIGGKHEPEPSPDSLSSNEKHNQDELSPEKSTLPDQEEGQNSNASGVDEKKSLRNTETSPA